MSLSPGVYLRRETLFQRNDVVGNTHVYRISNDPLLKALVGAVDYGPLPVQ